MLLVQEIEAIVSWLGSRTDFDQALTVPVKVNALPLLSTATQNVGAGQAIPVSSSPGSISTGSLQLPLLNTTTLPEPSAAAQKLAVAQDIETRSSWLFERAMCQEFMAVEDSTLPPLSTAKQLDSLTQETDVMVALSFWKAAWSIGVGSVHPAGLTPAEDDRVAVGVGAEVGALDEVAADGCAGGVRPCADAGGAWCRCSRTTAAATAPPATITATTAAIAMSRTRRQRPPGPSGGGASSPPAPGSLGA